MVVGEVGEDVVVDVLGELDANHIGVLHGTHDRPTKARAILASVIYGLGISNAVLDHVEGLTPQGVL